MTHTAIWHDVECGSYAEDRALWRELADADGGPVLDVGAGTGRVALDLAACGIAVVALDADAELLATLTARADALPVETVCADARDFDLDGRTFGLIVVPMQTVQLLGGPAGRAAFLACARAHLAPGGLVAAALADALESFDADSDGLPDPDWLDVDGTRFTSLPLAVIDEGDRAAIHRLREVIAPDGSRRESHDVTRLDRLSPARLGEEARALGFTVEPSRRIPATDAYVGSTVVILRG